MHEWLDELKIRVTNNTYETYRMNLRNMQCTQFIELHIYFLF